MGETFRQAMAYLHTWLGLVLGFVLMSCFFFGSLSVFDRELDRWSVPESRGAAQPLPSFDKVIAPMIAGVRPEPASLRQAAAEVIGPAPPGGTGVSVMPPGLPGDAGAVGGASLGLRTTIETTPDW